MSRCFLTKGFCLLGLVFLSACTSLFFYPQKELLRTPSDLDLTYESVQMVSIDGTRLSAWRLNTDKPRKGVIYFLHGNAENISTHIASVYWLPEQGYDVLMLDYRGFGHSEGEPSLPEVFDDIETGFQWINQHYSSDENIYFMGQSIGAALGVYWLAHSTSASSAFQGIVLDAPFASYPAMVANVLQRSWLTWLFANPVSWFFSGHYNPERFASQLPVETPILYFHSKDDQVVPFEQSSHLYSALSSPKIEVVTEGAHISTFNYFRNRKRLLDFFAANNTQQ